MGGTSRRHLEALRDYMVQEATRQRNVYKRQVDDIYFSRENWTLIGASSSKTITAPKNDIFDKYLILFPTFLGEHVPKQKNSFDCGVFCITYADFLTEGFDFSEFSQDHMPILRRKLGANILQVMNFY
jgi:hypothetical protein